MHVFLLFFSWPSGATWSNVLAMPACGLFAVVSAACFRKPAAKWWRKHFGHSAELAEIRDLAARAHRIAAATFEHHTGRPHPDAPERSAVPGKRLATPEERGEGSRM